MAASRSICIRCGSSKRRPVDTCAQCSFKPSDAEDIAKSTILTTIFDVGEHTYGSSAAELDRAAALISSGEQYPFNSDEVARIARERRAFDRISSSILLRDLVRWLGPPILFLGLLWWLLLR